MTLTPAQRIKFRLLSEGLTITDGARRRLDEYRGDRMLTSADYVSTSGVILRLDDEVWANAPITDYNPNFVSNPRNRLDAAGDGFVLCSEEIESRAWVCLPPRYHGQVLSSGRPINHFAYTHADRVRLSPIRGCAMRCRFCNVPYEDPYETKPLDLMIEALGRAIGDPLQPAGHVLISGGTPRIDDVAFLQDVYERILESFPDQDVDIMMVPMGGRSRLGANFDLTRLRERGVNEVSINIELFNPEIAQKFMPEKHQHVGLAAYLRYIGEAVDVLGAGRVRSMALVGLEPIEDTLAGVRAILDAGAVPVLSPFRPSPVTPLRELPALSALELEGIFLRCTELAARYGTALGPACPPCTHNTLTLVPLEGGAGRYRHPMPVVV